MEHAFRLVELLGALSLTTDLGAGMPFEKGLRTCAVATRLAEMLGLSSLDRVAVFYVALLRSLGCTAHASALAAMFDDDVAIQRELKVFDVADPGLRAAQVRRFAGWSEDQRAEQLADRFASEMPARGEALARGSCEVSAALGRRLSIPDSAVVALDEVYERYDGRGFPAGRAGDELTIAARVVHVAEQAVMVHHDDGAFAAAGQVARRDLKGRFLLGHSTHVAQLADRAAELSDFDEEARKTVRVSALLLDLGRVGVSSSVWDRPGRLGPVEWERVRLHSYWTERILSRCRALARLAPLAAAHHERLDGSGYHRAARGMELSAGARLLAVADAFAAMTEARPHREACTREQAARQLHQDVQAGRLDAVAVGAVIEAAGLPRRRTAWPNDLTDREVEVLRVLARGLSNREIAETLVLSPRTVQHHLASVYDKIDLRTRAGAAVFAIEHGLVPAPLDG